MAVPSLSDIQRADGRSAFDVPSYISTTATLAANTRYVFGAPSADRTLTLPTGCAVNDVIWVHRVFDATGFLCTIVPGASGSFGGTSDTSVVLMPKARVGFRWKSSNVWEVIQ